MSAQGTPAAPAGWYPDPQDAAQGRYWDGSRWTDAVHLPGTPLPPAPPLKAPEGTDGNTPWIWLIILLPLLPTLLLLFVPWGSMFDIDPRNAYSSSTAVFAIFLSPFYWLAIVLGYAIYGLNAFFAYRDYRQLIARGVPRPFHWAWTFLNPVYPFGRSIVVARRTGHGHATLWAEIGVIVVNVLVVVVIMVLMLSGMSDLFGQLARDYPTA